MSDEAKKEAKPEPPERWSAQRKTEVVLRLLRGEDLVEVSRGGAGCASGGRGVA